MTMESGHLCNIRKLHLNAVLVFVSFHCHNLKVTSVEELSADFSVDAATMGNDIRKLKSKKNHLRS